MSMQLTQSDEALAMLARLSVDQLLAGLKRGAKHIAVLGDPAEYATARNYTIGHPNFEMRETTTGREHYGKAFAQLRLKLEVAMVDTYQELLRRGVEFDRSNIRLLYLPDWKLLQEDHYRW